MALLEVRDLSVSFATLDGVVRAVDGVSYELERGRTLGLVGESGSGKSVSALTIIGLTRSPNATIGGQIVLDGRDLVSRSDAELRRIRGKRIAMIFQDPLSSLHPYFRIGVQIVEAIRTHEDVSKRAARLRAIEALEAFGIPRPGRRIDSYPHELSGGMRQRAMLAMALALRPDVLIADEPTTALDVTVQAQVLELIRSLRDEHGIAVLLITHDLGVIAQAADEVAVMYAGRIVEHAPRDTIFESPEHPYTWGLLDSIPHLDAPRGERLRAIQGQPPSLIRASEGASSSRGAPTSRRLPMRSSPSSPRPRRGTACAAICRSRSYAGSGANGMDQPCSSDDRRTAKQPAERRWRAARRRRGSRQALPARPRRARAEP